MYSRADCALHGFPSLVDVILVGPGQPCNAGRRRRVAVSIQAYFAPNRVGNKLDRLQVARTCSGEARFHDIDTEASQLFGDLQFFLGIQRGAGALFTVAQCGIENNDSVAVCDLTCVRSHVLNRVLIDVDNRIVGASHSVGLTVTAVFLVAHLCGHRILLLLKGWTQGLTLGVVQSKAIRRLSSKLFVDRSEDHQDHLPRPSPPFQELCRLLLPPAVQTSVIIVRPDYSTNCWRRRATNC